MKKRLIVLFSVLLIASLVVVGAFASNNNTGSLIYNVPDEFLLNSNRKVLQTGDNLVFLSSEDNKTLISYYDSNKNTISTTSELSSIYTGAATSDDKLAIAIPGEDGIKTEIKIYNFNKKTNEIIPTNCTLINDNSLAFDSLDNLYIAAGSSVYYYNLDTLDVNEISFPEEVISVRAAQDNSSVYAVTSKKVYKLSQTQSECIDFPAENIDVKFFSDTEAIDANGDMYSYSDEVWRKEYSTLSEFNTVSKVYDNTDIVIKDKIYALDSVGNAIGEYGLQVDCEILFVTDNKLLSISDLEDDAKIEILDIDSMNPPTCSLFDELSNKFVTDPSFGDVKYEDVCDMKNWQVVIDIDEITSNVRGEPVAKIKNTNTNESYVLTLGAGLQIEDNGATLTFTAPSNLEGNNFEVEIDNLCTTEGIPAIIKYNISVSSKNDPDDPDDPDIPTEITSNVYDINQTTNIVTNILPGTTLSQFKENIIYNGEITAVTTNGSIINSGKLGTGDTISMVVDGETVDTLSVVIFGDLTDDGNISASDTDALKNHMLGKEKLYSYQNIAADVNHDGAVDNIDLVMISKSAKGRYVISQNVE